MEDIRVDCTSSGMGRGLVGRDHVGYLVGYLVHPVDQGLVRRGQLGLLCGEFGQLLPQRDQGADERGHLASAGDQYAEYDGDRPGVSDDGLCHELLTLFSPWLGTWITLATTR